MRHACNRGSALIVTLLALSLLFSLGVPFLLTSRMRSEASREGYDRSRARVAVESAADWTEFEQVISHPAQDPTPFYDAAEEWNVANSGSMPQALGGSWEKANESWGAEVESAQARVSLGSAPPLLWQNLLHPCFLTEDIDFTATEIPVTSTEGFPESGLLRLGIHWVEYASKSSSAFLEVSPSADPPEELERTRFGEGQAVIDQRIFSMAMARLQSGGHRAPEFLNDLLGFDFGDPDALLPEADRRYLESVCWLSSGDFGAEDWGPGVYLQAEINDENPAFARTYDGGAFSPGTVVRVEVDGRELLDTFAIDAYGQRGMMLATDLPRELPVLDTVLRPLRREPVDINACRPEILEALVVGLRFRGGAPVISTRPPTGNNRRHYVSAMRARTFAEAVVAARPVEGPDDLWYRVLEPLILSNRLSHVDAWVIYLNGVDPNNGALAASTTSFAYRSGDRYLTRLNAAVRARLGRTLARRARFLDRRVAPDGPLIGAWETQLGFEDAARYGRGMHRTLSLPGNRGFLGGHMDGQPLSGLTLRTGAYEPTGTILASQDAELSAILPAPAREAGLAAGGRIQHWDFEPSPLGWNLGEQGPLPFTIQELGLAVGPTGGSDSAPLLLQGWFEMPRDGVTNGVLFDLAGDAIDRARVTAAIEEGQLVVKAYDNAGEDPGDPDGQEEALTVRLDAAEYPIQNRWFHVNVLMRSIAHGGLQVAVDGVPRGQTLGRTRLTSALSGYAPGDSDPTIAVESTEGFPSAGVLRIGDEVIEYSSKTATSFVCVRSQTAEGWIGGRAAREPSDSLVNIRDTLHPEGSGVELYGYTAFLESDIPPGGARMISAVGPWSCAVGVEGPETIQMMAIDGRTFDIGDGMSGDYLGPIELAPMVAGDTYYSEAFQADGGYAMIAQRYFQPVDSEGFRIGGFEVVRYNSREGTTLNIIERKVLTTGVQNSWPGWATEGLGNSFVFEWRPYMGNTEYTTFEGVEELRTFILPISIRGDSVSDLRYLLPTPQNSEFVQITHTDDVGLTEWVRYDSIIENSFVRDDWGALNNAILDPMLRGGYQENYDPPTSPPPGSGGGPGGTGGGGGGGGAGEVGGGGMLLLRQDPVNDHKFTRRLGLPVEDRDPLLSDISQRFQFRGVLGTFDHDHPGGEELVPVFQTRRPIGESPNTGYVGRLDRVSVLQPDNPSPPAWYTVMWGTAPFPFDDGRVRRNRTYVAFTTSTGLPYAHTDLSNLGSPGSDGRLYARLSKFPNGERPGGLNSLFLGSGVGGSGGIFGGLVDEFAAQEPAGMGPGAVQTSRGSFVLVEDLEAGADNEIHVHPLLISVDGQNLYGANAGQWLANLPQQGLLEIDGERVVYSSLDPQQGIFEVAVDGRALHGTTEGGHAAGTKVWVVDSRPITFLQNDISASESTLVVESSVGFNNDSLLLIDQELLHAPIVANGNTMMMPRYEQELDPQDGLGERGDGILRGRFGTVPGGHAAGSLVYGYPNRWTDRYAPQSNSPSGAWYQIGMEEPGAYWDGILFEAEEPDASHRVRVLARSGPAQWSDPPDETPGLVMVDRGSLPGGLPVPLGLHGDHLDLRVCFDWELGAFDSETFLATAWTVAPRLRHLRLYYYAETRTDRQEEIFE